MMMPPVVAAFSRAFARICGCHRFFTSLSSRVARSGRGFLIWFFTYRSTVRCEIRSIWATALVPLSCLTRYRICAGALLGTGRVNAFCTAASRPSPNMLIALYLLPGVLVGDGAVLDVPGEVEFRGVELLAHALAPEHALGALPLHQARVHSEFEAAGQWLAVPVGQEVQRRRPVGGVDGAVREDGHRVLPGE